MKIGILTQPLFSNYGGILQAYALQTCLERLGHEVWVIDRRYEKTSLGKVVVKMAKRIVLKYLFRKNVIIFPWTIQKLKNQACRELHGFITEKIRQTEPIYTTSLLKKILIKYQFEAIIVGSDQVWRPCYSPCITNYFLDFLPLDSQVKRLAYAVSFGTGSWEFSSVQTRECRSLAKHFEAISVRESSAIKMCERYLLVKAIQLIDPTMLLNVEDYIRLMDKRSGENPKNGLLVYLLNYSDFKQKVINTVANYRQQQPMISGIYSDNIVVSGHKETFPGIGEWLQNFWNADFIITDSFHGCVFSILFNKSFLVMGNIERGMDRFTSLLKLFHLEDRLILSSEDLITEKINTPIDWERVNLIREQKKILALNFLMENLK